MSTAKFDTLSNVAGTQTVPVATVAQGSAKAWVNFNGTGTVAIRAAFNVTSITDNGTGDYTVNFTTAMVDSNYAASIVSQGTNTSNLWGPVIFAGTSTGGAQFVAPTASAVRFSTWTSTLSGQADSGIVNVVIFR
jgi:flagellar capping protein FliD